MIALLAPLVVQAAVTGFAPPLDRALACEISETRVDGAATLRFVIQRRVTFRAAPGGFVAEVETVSATGDAGRAGKMFEAMARALSGRRVVLTLDRAGKVTDVADLDTLWAAQLAAMTATVASKDTAGDSVATALIAPLQSLSRDAKVAWIAQAVAPLIASEPVTPGPPRTITLPARGRDGATALLAGTESVVVAPQGMLLFDRRAAGLVSGVMTTISQHRRIDPRTGLAAETVNITTIETGGARLIVTRSTTLTP